MCRIRQIAHYHLDYIYYLKAMCFRYVICSCASLSSMTHLLNGNCVPGSKCSKVYSSSQVHPVELID